MCNVQIKEMLDEHIDVFSDIYHMRETDVLLWQQEDSKRYNHKPGQGVTIIDNEDQNAGRDGFVREQSGEHYNIFFEPGDRDGKYRIDQLKPNGRFINPKNIPDPEK